jgi:hypothetical protein
MQTGLVLLLVWEKDQEAGLRVLVLLHVLVTFIHMMSSMASREVHTCPEEHR